MLQIYSRNALVVKIKEGDVHKSALIWKLPQGTNCQWYTYTEGSGYAKILNATQYSCYLE